MDVSVVFDNNKGTADWQLINGDVAIADSDLLSSVLVMLFSDRRCTDDFRPSDGNPRGWWGSTFEPYDIGSRLWQLDRAKFSAATPILLEARDYTREAMQVFIDQGIASDVIVNVSKVGSNRLNIQIQMIRPGIPSPTTFTFAWSWAQLGL